MNNPKSILVQSYSEWVINTKKNIYGKRHADRVWNKLLVNKLTSQEIGFSQSKVYECVFYSGNIIYIMYTANYITEGSYE